MGEERMARPAEVASSGLSAPRPIGKVRLSHPERVVLAEPPTTKADVWRYYAAVADHVLPGIVGRPLSVVRCPSGAEGGCFFQRHLMPGMPKVVRPVLAKGSEGEEEYFAVDDLEGLMALVQFGVIELHPWGARADRLDRPDRLVFDLDPAEGLGWDRVVAAGRELRDRLRAVGLESFARTTGGKGLHLVVPIDRRHGWPAAKRFAGAIARAMATDSPDRYTAKLTKAARTGRIFIDYLRNEHSASAVASYSLRARRGATVAMPLAWAEVGEDLRPDEFTMLTVRSKLKGRADPWAELSQLHQRLPGRAGPR
jgi:bifunctional non-homologous end joining protein LigD